MVPDDPFTADPKAGAVTTSGGSATPSTITRPRSALHINISPPEHTEPVRDPDESGVIHMRTQGAGSGTKTPRRVQWEKESHVVQLEPMPSPNTVNRQNVMHIDAALERHRSNPRRPPIARMISEDGEDEDYDYRLDTGVPPGARLGGVRSNESHQQGNEPQSLSDILDDGINRHIDGETNIPLGETDGLPSIPNQGADNNSAAKNLVRAHTGKWGVLRRRVRGAGAVNNAFGGGGKGEVVDEKATRQREDDFAARYPEPEEEDHGHGRMHGMPPGMAGMPGGASVLSSLLALYNQQNLPGSGATSGATSAASSRPSSIYSQSDEEDTPPRKATPEMPAVRKTASGWWHPPRRNESNKSMQEVVINEENRRPSEVVMDLEPPNLEQLRGARSQSTSSLGSASGPSVGFMKSLKKAKEVTYDKTANRVKAEVNEYDRPKAARSGAGVFGALIQNTQNITGAATPTGATLAPAAARPGYQLNRYTLPTDVPQVTSPWRPASRLSNSTSRSRPTSVHSSTAVSDGGASPSDMKKVHSSDDMLAMKEKNRNRSGLRLDTLGKMPMQAVMAGGQALKTGANTVRNAEKWVMSGGKTPLLTPPGEKRGDSYFGRPLTEEERRRKEYEADKKRRRKAKEARKKQEIFIIQHVAAILARQQFLMKLARALMMFGSPSHRLETQLQATARVLELNAQVVYLPGTMLLSFGDDATHTSETKFLKQATGLDLGKLLATHRIYWNVVHDRMSVEQASKDLDMLMTTPVYYSWWQTLIIGGFASSFICVVGFYGSFIDAVVAAPLGALLCGIQMLSARNDMFSNVFEIAVACIISFIAAGLSSTGVFCYTALVSGGVVLILPGYIVLCGALELASRNITAGAVRIGYSVIYSLFLGFGISIGAEMFRQITGREVSNPNDYTCANTHIADIWWRVTPSAWWYFLCCPGFAFMLSLRNQQPLFAKEMPIMVLIACAGWASNHFSARVFVNRSDMTSAIGSFVVGTLGNLYGKLSKGSSFPVTVVGILFQLPSGLSNGGIFNFAVESSSGSTQAYSSGFEVAQQLVSVAIGLTVGLFVSAAVTHPFGGGRRRGSGIFSF